ncbi:hypothetical protein EJ08DRAFT_125805 [Tothia fuscella]|uniref:Beta-lactamase-related domain-containing protein n=1 Tax=Tothia fuscella TaxID=1048955 RepID=A0A9P4NUR5_9PEZI|nr:hypothetical protein EJ08DRAFT_125805 [Tothia fuscella]
MTECGYGNSHEPNATAVEGIWPHAPGNPNPKPLPPTWETENPKLLGPAGTGRCSPQSYAKFLALHLDGANGRDTSILRASSFAKLHTPHRINSGSNDTAGGWMALSSSNPQIASYLGHDGSNTWNYASALVLPRLDTAVFALTNVAGPTPDTSDGQKGVSAAIQLFLNNTLTGLPIIEDGTVKSNQTGVRSIRNNTNKNVASYVSIGSVFVIVALSLIIVPF